MKRALVTGGCGFLGSWMVRRLIDRGVAVRVLAAKGEPRDNITGLDVDVVEGDVRSVDVCKRAVEGMDTVFHAAAIYKDWAPDPWPMYDVNLRGTFHVIEAARRAGVERVIYTASIVSVGRPKPGTLGDETTPYEAWDLDFPYSRSKLHSRELAEYFGAWDLDVRVVCPGIVFGPNDIRPTPSGGLIVGSLKTPGPAVAYEGGASYVDVRDAAEAHVLAAEKGRKGERYLATAHNLTNEELIRAIDRVTGRKRPVLRLPVAAARGIAIAMEAQAARTGQPPLLARDFFEYSLKPSYYSNAKSVRELGARYRPIEETIGDAVAWFRGRGMV
ncbi:NAD-dependent epimerase/dehydratase family protein [Sandaracinus amylolyticus]|uniref:NAD-dependent epimerase/dehydratase family protein n=1 Tax=Sandaracinus amylolyticus TaxID=927083 RepID=UPI001F00E39F|nr:NAD-dependent epimerase/dehydratase family protein [Sandaracinus amylolyticus]UJR80188.1 NAD-dependent dehydratase [Sandaracinus amylolyticus]